MKLSELLRFVGKHSLSNDPDIVIELEEDKYLKYTGVRRASVYTDYHGSRHLCLLPASPVVRQQEERFPIPPKNTITFKNLK
jgi:hypothetical protein